MTKEDDARSDRQLLRDAERHIDALRFDGLLDLASEVCLGKTIEYDSCNGEPSPEQRIVQALGTRGLSVAGDIITDGHLYYIGPDETEKGEPLITFSSPLRTPECFSREVDPDVQYKIEQFGTHLLDTAYRALGTDVNSKIAEFKNATSDEEQMTVLQWLDQRIRAFSKTGATSLESEDSEYFYHPIRLSPHALGQYPHNRYNPTCLGKSILTASFMAQTGAPFLHAGSIETLGERSYREVSNGLFELTERKDIPLTEDARMKLEAKGADMVMGFVNRGFHALTVTQLASGAWCTVDPNYQFTHKLSEADSKKVQNAHDWLTDFADIAKGVEQTVVLGYEDMEWSRAVNYFLRKMKPMELPTDEALAETLLGAEFDTLRTLLHDFIRKTLKGNTNSISDSNISPALFADECDKEASFVCYNESAAGCTILEHAMDEAICKFFFQEEFPDQIVQSMHRNESYLARKVDTLKALPYLTLVNCFLADIDDAIAYSKYKGHGHVSLECGLPAYRIGAAVLSDFATYLESDLSYLFWTTYWPSKIPLTERIDQISGIEHHNYPLAHNGVLWLTHALRYAHQNGIIDEQLSAWRKEMPNGTTEAE